MKNLILGTFFTATLIIAGSLNVNAQSKTNTETKVIKKHVALKKDHAEKVTPSKKLKTNPAKVPAKKIAPVKKNNAVKTKIVAPATTEVKINTTKAKINAKKRDIAVKEELKAKPAKLKKEAIKK